MTGLEAKDRYELDMALTLLKECGAREVYLFGSLARGEGDANSDWDFAVRGLPKELLFSALAKLMKLMTRSVELVDLDEATPFAAYIAAKWEFTRVT